jgi:hypothetical protein
VKLQRLAALDAGPENYSSAVQFNNSLKMYQHYADRFGVIEPKVRLPKRRRWATC